MQFCASCGEQTAEQPCTECGSDPRLDGRYVLRALLGQGSHGMTWRAEGADGAAVAVKVINLGHGLKADARRTLDREVAVLRQLSHPRIPGLIDDFSTRSGMTRYRCIVQELIHGEPLLAALAERRHTPGQVMAMLAEIAEILTYLHGLSPPIIHRDIKPQNLIRRSSDGALVLIDFGSVRDTLVGTLGGTMSVGTVGYMAPEQITGEVLPASDLYALGALAVHLLTRQPPSLTHDPADPIRWQKPEGLPSEIGALVDALLQPDPARRPQSAAEVCRLARQCAEAAPPPPSLSETQPLQVAAAKAARPSRSMVPLLALYPILGTLAVIMPLAALVRLESIAVTGVLGSILGLIVAFLAVQRRQVLGTLAALSAALISMLGVIALGVLESGAVAGPLPVLLGLFHLIVLSGAMAAAIRAQTQQRRAARAAPRLQQRQHLHVAHMPELAPVIGSRREREDVKAIARQWRSGVVPEARHLCPFCGDAATPSSLVRHYDTIHLPPARRRRRRQHHLL